MQPSNHQSHSVRLGAPLGAALLSGTALAMICLVAAPAFAGEIDVLKEQLQALQKKVDQISTNQTKKMATKGRPKVQLEVSGQVNRAVLYADNGPHEQIFNVDNSNSGTRVRWVAKARLNDDLSAGATIEIGAASNSNSKVVMGQNSSRSFSWGERKLEFWLNSKKMGRVWVGQGDTASNGTSEVDLAGTQVVAYSGIDGLAGGICFHSGSSGNGACTGPTIGSVWSNLDGLSRNDRIRYDTPTIAGFKASASYVEAEQYDIALRYGANYEAIGTKVSAAIAFENVDGPKSTSTADHQLNGSISVLHSSGFSVTYAMGETQIGGGEQNKDFWYVKGGWQTDVPSPNLGRFAISFDYGEADNMGTTGDADQLSTWGVAVTQKVAKLGAEFYFAFRNHDLEGNGEDYNDVNAALLGARIKF